MSLMDLVRDIDAQVRELESLRDRAGASVQTMQAVVGGAKVGKTALQDSIATVVAFYKRSMGLGERNFPDNFFTNDETREVAALIANAQKILLGDDLITFAEAAVILGRIEKVEDYNFNNAARTFLHDKTKGNKPAFTLYYDLDDAHPKRVSKTQVTAYREDNYCA